VPRALDCKDGTKEKVDFHLRGKGHCQSGHLQEERRICPREMKWVGRLRRGGGKEVGGRKENKGERRGETDRCMREVMEGRKRERGEKRRRSEGKRKRQSLRAQALS
jgi:hypothetical protein